MKIDDLSLSESAVYSLFENYWRQTDGRARPVPFIAKSPTKSEVTLKIVDDIFERDIPKIRLDFFVQGKFQIHQQEALVQICQERDKKKMQEYDMIPSSLYLAPRALSKLKNDCN